MIKNFDIKKYMLHKYPMLFVDEILEESENRGRTKFVVKKDNIFVDESGNLSRAAFIEIAAQSFAAVDLYQKTAKRQKTSKGFLVNVREFVFFGDAKIGDELQCAIERTDNISQMHIVKTQMFRNEIILANGEFRIFELAE
jgi:predicted hotdog family 3-hydroxylacyl-ACP dehydratase